MRKNITPKFQEFLFNELVKALGSNISKTPLIDRLEKSYEIIKSQPKIYNKFHEHNFFMSFVKANQILVLPTDNKDMKDLINYSFMVLEANEKVSDTYYAITEEINKVKKSKVTA